MQSAASTDPVKIPIESLEVGDLTRDKYEHLSQGALERLGYPGARCLWTITTGRSGTMWLQRLLGQVGGFIATHEPYPSLFFEGRLHLEGKCDGNCTRLLRMGRGTLVRTAYYKHWVYAECSTLLSHMAPCLREAYPSSKFLNLVRDPRTFICSAVPRGWYQFDRVNAHWWPRSVPYKEPWQRLAWFWAETHRKGLELEREWGPDVVRRIRCEDMWAPDGADTIRDLVEWAGHTQPDFSRGAYYEAVGSKVNKGKPVRWRKSRDRFLREVAGDLLEEYGYGN